MSSNAILDYAVQKAPCDPAQVARERDKLRLLLEVNNAIVSTLDLRELFVSTSACLRRVLGHEYASLTLYDAENHDLHVHALDNVRGKGFMREGLRIPLDSGTPSALAFTTRQPVVIGCMNLKEFPSEVAQRLKAEGLRSGCCVPLLTPGRVSGTLNLGSSRDDAFSRDDVELISQIAKQVALAVENALSFQLIVDLHNRLAEEKLYLEEEINTAYNFEEVIGSSPALKRILKQVATVAPTDSTVLIQGETGTGKELIARAIHNLSNRRERTLVKLNCAAIPTGLLESELFGHEKGAFTGAITQRIGRFELANHGTLFLDEVGDIPLELQPKLLRVLQEQEFERLGGTRTMRVDVRVVAATNSNLAQMVNDKLFRSDLYYRLNVFPITLPPLRERGDDIVRLTHHFVQKFRQRFKKKVQSLNQASLERLRAYPWPGNIRELENFVERAVLLAEGETLTFDTTMLPPQGNGHSTTTMPTPVIATAALQTLAEVERGYISEVLRHTQGVISGKNGAAEILGLPPSTLRSRMKKLGLTHP